MKTLPSLRQLRYFVVLADTRHFRKAAERLGISQPSLSLQIGNLEELTGMRLFERGRGPVTLTPEGREVLARAQSAIEEVRGIVDLAGAFQDGMTGTIRLGTTPTIGPYLLPLVVERLHRTYPELQLYIRERAPRDLRDELVGGNLDVILTQLPESGADLVSRRLFREPLLLAFPADHALASKLVLSESDLSDLNVLSLGPEYTMHSQIAAICRDHGAVLARDYEGTSLDALRQMVGMGMGVAFLPRLYARSEIEGRRSSDVSVLPFRRNTIMRAVGLVWRAGANPVLFDRLFDVMHAALRDSLQLDGAPIIFDG